MASSYVPTEIIVEILLKLPVKPLLRCKSVCKQWYSLISDQCFIKSQLTLAPCNTHCRFISFDNHSKSFRLYNNHVMLGKSVDGVELDHNHNPFTAKYSRARIIGSCNGLLCVINVVKGCSTIFLWNPSTRRVNTLPSSGRFSNKQVGIRLRNDRECRLRNDFEYFNPCVGFGFGYDESSDDYKVIEIICGNPILRGVETRVKMYSLKSGFWKRLICDLPCGFLGPQDDGMFMNGALHWTIGHTNSASSKFVSTLVSFDLATDTFSEILQPVYDEELTDLTLCTFGEWLSLVSYLHMENRSDVWVMKVYGVQDSWTKLVSIPHQTVVPDLPLRLTTNLCITQDGKFLLKLEKEPVWYDPENSSELVLYDPENSSFTEIQKIDTDSIHTFVESLVSPMPSSLVSPMPRDRRSRDTHGFLNSIISRFKKICAPGHIWSCLSMPNIN